MKTPDNIGASTRTKLRLIVGGLKSMNRTASSTGTTATTPKPTASQLTDYADLAPSILAVTPPR
ncbi:MAG: hypothetical protein VX589_08335, partial [Myxococcota bacterium]|nr:hypothetical protein [Myxococcota bacterium]